MLKPKRRATLACYSHRRAMLYIHPVKMLLLPILLLLLQTQAKASGENVQCITPQEKIHHSMHLQEALFMDQCHLICIKKYINETIALELAVRRSHQWPHLRTADILAQGNCNTFQKVMECRRGCFLRSQDVNISRDVCRNQCISECDDNCGTGESCDFYSSSSCPILCRKNVCGVGCALTKQLASDAAEQGRAPLTPNHSFSLVKTSSRSLAGGLYNITLTDGVSGDDVMTNGERNLNAFIARVEADGSSYYFPLTSPGDVLDLSQFSCESVNFSLAAVNLYSMSDFSPAMELAVYGDTGVPSQLPLDGIQYEWVENTQPGYEGTAVVNITWEPQNGSEFITSYSITFFSETESCGGKWVMQRFDNIGDKHTTYFVWMAMKNFRMAIIGCSYQTTITAKPCMDDSCRLVERQHVFLDDDHKKDSIPPTMDLICHKYVNQTTGVISVFLQLEVKNTLFVTETIERYKILTKLVDTHTDIPRVLKTTSEFYLLANGSRMAYVVHGIAPDPDVNHQIILRVTPENNDDYSWRQIPAYQECRVNIYPQQPSVPTAAINSFLVNETSVFLNVTPAAPATPFGKVESYEVVLVREPVPSGEDPLTLNLVRGKELELDSDNKNGILEVENVNSAYRHIDQDTLCLFLHIRAKNEYLWSEWSEPILLERNPTHYSNCSALQEPQNSVALRTYVAVSVSLVALAVLAILTGYTVSRIYSKYRIRKQMKNTFQDPGYENPIFRRYDMKRRNSALWLPLDAPKADDWELPSSNILLTDEEPLGEGCFGLVHRGVVKGPIVYSRTMRNSICINVAVKFLKKTATGSERSDFLTEIDTMKLVAEGNNPHVVNMIGCVTVQEPICLVTEFVVFGDLLTYLTTIRRMMTDQTELPTLTIANDGTDTSSPTDKDTPSPKQTPTLTSITTVISNDDGDNNNSVASDEVEEKPPSSYSPYDKLNPYANLGEVEPVNIVSFAYQIASGMEYLSSLGIVHRDLATRNILVGEGKQLKISDFGMARATVDEVYVKSTKGRLPWKWMAIESIMSREFTSATDVWAYGVTLWEIGTLGVFPYPTTANSDLLELLRKGNRLERPPNCTEEIYDIMLNCWQETPDKRPTFTDLKTMFAEMLQENSLYMQLHNHTHKPHDSTHSTVLDNYSSTRPLSGEGSSVSDHTPSLASTADSSPLDHSTCELLKDSTAVEVVTTTSLEEQSSLIPLNLYVDTPTNPKGCENENVTILEQTGDHSSHSSHDINTYETAV